MGYISNNKVINLLPLSTSQPHHGNDHHQLITAPTVELGDRRNNLPATSRWNPTPEQITTLEELYRSGIRTPTTEQIQQIASKLSKYGRIEGKNVFYWFQNHKARDRLKRRRREGDDAFNNVRNPQRDLKDSSSGDHRVDQTKSCPCFHPTHSQPQDELVPANHNKDKNINNEDHGTTEESQRASEDGKNATWINLVNSLVTQELGDQINNSLDENEYNVDGEEEQETREIRTLDLFPVMENQEKTDRFREKQMNTKANQLCCNYCYYYEFMPLKN